MKTVLQTRSTNNRWFNEFDHLLDDFFQPQTIKKSFTPSLDVQETEDFILLSLDIPGVEEKHVDVKVENKTLSVSGERISGVKETSNVRSFSEKRFGKFKRSFKLPEVVESEKIEANYANGVLHLLLPKKEKDKPKKLDVKFNDGNFLKKLVFDKGQN